MSQKSKRSFLFCATAVSTLTCAACASSPPQEAIDDNNEPGDGIDGDSNEDILDIAEGDNANSETEGDLFGAETGVADLDDDLIRIPDDAIPSDLDQAQLANGSPQIVYVNFGGPIVRSCSGFCNDALNNRSSLIRQTFGRSSVDFLPYTSTTGKQLIMSRLRTYYAPYNVNMTTRRPTSGSYMMMVISPSAVGPSSKRGVAYLDCGNNATRRDVAFVFRIRGVSAGTIARYATHEIGHTLGLMHVKSSLDLMQYASSGTRFTKSTLDVARNPPGYTCFPGSTVQNAPATLIKNVGRRP